MEKRRDLITYLWVLSLLALPLSNLPNRILLGLLLIWFFAEHGADSLRISQFKLFAVISVTLLILSAMTNKVLSKELMLGLSIPAQGFFLLIVRPSRAEFKKGFHLAVITVMTVLLVMKATTVFQTGFSNYFRQEQWWNLWHYKSLTQSLSLHPTYLSLFLLAGCVMLLFGNDLKVIKGSANRGGWALLVFYLISIWLVSSKIALIALALVLLIFWIYTLNHSSRGQTIRSGVLISIVLSLPFASPSIRYRITHELTSAMQALPAEVPNRMTERRALWKSALIEMDRHPIAGTSFRGIRSRDAIYAKAKFFYSPLEKPMNAHNNFIEFGLRYGILFGILLLFTSIFGLYKAFSTRSLEILSFGIALVAVSMTESFLFREQGLSLASLMLLFYCLNENERNI